MTSGLLQTLMKSLGALGALLLIGTFLRAKIPIFRKMLVPASVIGGFIGLFLGPELLGGHTILPFPHEWKTTWSLMPSILIVPIFAAIPLGNFGKKNKEHAAEHSLHKISRITMVTSVHATQMGSQIAIGVLAAVLLAQCIPHFNLYENFGFELSQGFNGGHGTAGAVANVLMEAGVERWELVQGVATTFATIGLLGGILLGIVHINRAAKNGRTVLLKEASVLPDAEAAGIQKDISKQGSVGRETTSNSNIECLTVHIALIFIASTLAYLIRGAATKYNMPGFKEVPVWPYALIVMYVINYVLKALKLQWLIDSKVKSHLSGMLADIAITAAIASMPLKAVAAYLIPMVIVSIIGFILVYFASIIVYRFLLPDSCPFERGIYVWGMGTGVMMTGLALLKICDPNYDLPVLEDYSVASIIISITDLVALPIMYHILCYGTSRQMIVFGAVYTLCFIASALIGKVVYEKTKTNTRNAAIEGNAH